MHRRDPTVKNEFDKTRKNIEDYCSLISVFNPDYDIRAVETKAIRLLRDIHKRHPFLAGTAPIKACALIRLASELLEDKRVLSHSIPYSQLRDVTELATNSVIEKVRRFKRLLSIEV